MPRRPSPGQRSMSRIPTRPARSKEVAVIRNALAHAAVFAAAIAFSTGVAGTAQAQHLKLSSPDFKPNGTIAEEQVYNGFGCTGKNISPALTWSGAPKGAKSFALLVHDPDAPTGGAGWW